MRLAELQLGVRQFLAWKSIWNEQETLNLDQFQTKQAEAVIATLREEREVGDKARAAATKVREDKGVKTA